MLAHIQVGAGRNDLRRVSAANKGWRVELQADGELTMTPPAGGASGRRNHALAMLIGAWADANDFFAFDSSAGFTFASGAVLSSDGALVARATWEALSDEECEDFVPLVPSLFRSSSQRATGRTICARSFIALAEPVRRSSC